MRAGRRSRLNLLRPNSRSERNGDRKDRRDRRKRNVRAPLPERSRLPLMAIGLGRRRKRRRVLFVDRLHVLLAITLAVLRRHGQRPRTALRRVGMPRRDGMPHRVCMPHRIYGRVFRRWSIIVGPAIDLPHPGRIVGTVALRTPRRSQRPSLWISRSRYLRGLLIGLLIVLVLPIFLILLMVTELTAGEHGILRRLVGWLHGKGPFRRRI